MTTAVSGQGDGARPPSQQGGSSALGPFRNFTKEQLKTMVKAAGKPPATDDEEDLDPARKRHQQCVRYYTLGVLGLPMKLTAEALVPFFLDLALRTRE